jgi:Zn-finger nucleic acid-binding protein
MDLSGPGAAYRSASVRCPGCGAIMRAEHTPTARIDVCDACEGLWVDWFDGDVHAVALEQELARVERGTPLPDRPSARPSGSGVCPHCTQRLVAELYRFPDARDDELVDGVELLRCAECAGAFVPRGSAHLLLERAREGRAATLWEVLFAMLQRLFGGSANRGP